MYHFKVFRVPQVVLALLLGYGCSTDNFSEALSAAPAEAVWIDVRSAAEYASGHITSASNIAHKAILAGVSGQGLAKDTPIYLYCGSGYRANVAKDLLESQQYTHVVNVGGLHDARALLNERE